jgi:hypothetical protein
VVITMSELASESNSAVPVIGTEHRCPKWETNL